MKIYTKSTYRDIIDFIDVSDRIKKSKDKKGSTLYNYPKFLKGYLQKSEKLTN
jgi:hypothetical protein